MELTPKEIEDRKILDECKKEAFLKRGVPLAIFNGTAIYLAINSRKILWAKGIIYKYRVTVSLLAAILGKTFAEASYIPICIEKSKQIKENTTK